MSYSYEQFFHKKLMIENQRCVIARDASAYYVFLRETDHLLSRDEDEQRAIEIATEALRLAAKRNETPCNLIDGFREQTEPGENL
jgi:hypothetical protein